MPNVGLLHCQCSTNQTAEMQTLRWSSSFEVSGVNRRVPRFWLIPFWTLRRMINHDTPLDFSGYPVFQLRDVAERTGNNSFRACFFTFLKIFYDISLISFWNLGLQGKSGEKASFKKYFQTSGEKNPRKIQFFFPKTQETTLNYGGAQYIPTGRGLATRREPFLKSFRCFAASHMYDALEASLGGSRWTIITFHNIQPQNTVYRIYTARWYTGPLRNDCFI